MADMMGDTINLFDFTNSAVMGKVAAMISCVYERAGPWYEIYDRRRTRQHTLSTGSTVTDSASDSDDSDVELDEDDEDFLRSLDPKEWKDQDHYKVLGLSKLRWKATNAQVRVAYKKKVLLHHPDKRKHSGKEVNDDDDYFTNITKAYETLGNPTTKRSYDSVDPEFDESVPSSNISSDNFYDEFTPCFQRNARWAVLKRGERVPDLGTSESTREQVDRFYTFWYSFNSWREFSYLDEEDKEKGSDRYERRMIEQDNKKARKERSKEETQRIRQLVDNAYNCDPRVLKFKQDDKEKKQAAKKAKQDAARARAEQEEQQRKEAEAEALKKKEEEERINKEQAAAAKKEKDALKNALKKERKTCRNKIKEYDYFSSDESKRLTAMENLDQLMETLDISGLKSLNTKLNESQTAGEEAFKKQVSLMQEKLEEERSKLLAGSSKSGQSKDSGKSASSWSAEEVQLLIKAVNLFPAGTNNRWEVVSSFITQHLPNSKRSAKEVLHQAKHLNKDDLLQKKLANDAAFKNTMQNVAVKGNVSTKGQSMDDPSKRYMSPGEALVVETGENTTPWTGEEQKLFEQALKTYPKSPDRFDKVAACLPTRSKRDCINRFKELAQLVKAKRVATESAAAHRK